MIYDWIILLLPAILLWQANISEWKSIYALVWVATLISDPLTLAQMKALPFAIQINVPIFSVVIYWIYRNLRAAEQNKAGEAFIDNHGQFKQLTDDPR